MGEDARLARDSFARLAQDVVAPLVGAIHREYLTVPDAILRPMCEMGALPRAARGGTEAQNRAKLPRIARGEPLCAIAITEPDFGSDVAGLQLCATKVAGGWRLDGAKTWCTFAGKAGLLMVVARTGGAGHRVLSIFEGAEETLALKVVGRALLDRAREAGSTFRR